MSALFSVTVLHHLRKIVKESAGTILNRNNKKFSFSPTRTTRKFCCTTAALENKNVDTDEAVKRVQEKREEIGITESSGPFPEIGIKSRNKSSRSPTAAQNVTPLSESVDDEEFNTTYHTDCGITELIGNHPKITGELKKLGTDFQVHEIDLTGRKVKLTDLKLIRGLPPPVTTDSLQDGANAEKMKPRKQYLHCTLFKELVSHYDAVATIGESLGVSPNKITTAGRKDRLAQTSQRISIELNENPKLTIKALHNNHPISKKMWLGNFVYASKPLKIGDLQGNHFKILLRNAQLGNNQINSSSTDSLTLVRNTVTTAMESFREFGYLNYFGLQRFSYYNFEIGAAVLRQQWEKVFDLMFAPKPGDLTHISQAKSSWFAERDPWKVFRCVSPGQRHLVNELNTGLMVLNNPSHRKKGDFKEAYTSIPWSSQNMHISGFTSLVWNRLLSERIRKFGLQVLPGDYVLDIDSLPPPSSPNHFDYYKPSMVKRYCKILTEEDLVEGHPYTIHDVHLPMFNVNFNRYPNLCIQEIFENILASQGLDPDCLLKSHFRDEFYEGTFRSIVIKPKNVNYRVVAYSDKDRLSLLLPSDLDYLRMTGTLKDETYEKYYGQGGQSDSFAINLNHGVKDKVGVILEYTLPAASYATMAIREIIQTYDPII